MKTKLKGKLKNNFLNNQNYILWKSEKRRLLSKFFAEYFIHSYNNILKYINKKLPNWLLIYLSIYSVIFIFIPLFKWFFKNPISSILFSSVIIFYTLFLFKDYKIFKWFHFKYSKNNYFLISKYSYIHLFFKYIFIVFVFFNILFFNTPLLFLLSLFISFIFLFLDFFKLIIFPIVIFLFILIYSYQYIYMIIFKGEKWYLFIKYTPLSNYFKRFNFDKKRAVENEYYEIKEKLF